METFLGGREPEILYPCAWTYKIIGSDEAVLRGLVADTVGALEHTLDLSRTSASGRYTSLQLVVTVQSDEQRKRIGSVLGSHPHVRLVL